MKVMKTYTSLSKETENLLNQLVNTFVNKETYIVFFWDFIFTETKFRRVKSLWRKTEVFPKGNGHCSNLHILISGSRNTFESISACNKI